jgi:hypothetical protein
VLILETEDEKSVIFMTAIGLKEVASGWIRSGDRRANMRLILL